MEKKIGSTVIRLIQGDITKEKTDVIVNAANTSLRGGGGVDGAIHRAGGPQILQECVQKYPAGCKTGEARITTAGRMAAKYVIHTPGLASIKGVHFVLFSASDYQIYEKNLGAIIKHQKKNV